MTTQPPAYHMQHDGNIVAMATFVESNARSVELPIDRTKFLSSGLIEHSVNLELAKFTRAEIYAGLELVYANCRADGPQACSVLPEGARKAGHVQALKTGYTWGKNGCKSAKLVPYALGKHRKANRSRKNATALADAVKAKTSVAYKGKNYANETLARKAACRDVHGPDWWMTDKESRLANIKLV